MNSPFVLRTATKTGRFEVSASVTRNFTVASIVVSNRLFWFCEAFLCLNVFILNYPIFSFLNVCLNFHVYFGCLFCFSCLLLETLTMLRGPLGLCFGICLLGLAALFFAYLLWIV